MPHENKIIWFQTTFKDKQDDFTKFRPYLIIENNDGRLLLVPITSSTPKSKKIKLGMDNYEIKEKVDCLYKTKSYIRLSRKIFIDLNKITHEKFLKIFDSYSIKKSPGYLLQKVKGLFNGLNNTEYTTFLIKYKNFYETEKNNSWNSSKIREIDLTKHIK